MSATQEAALREMSWQVKAAVFRGEKPKWAGNRNVAVLRCTPEDTLILDTGYELPGVAWRVLMGAAVVVLVGLAVVLKGHPVSHLSAEGVAGIFAIYVLLLWSHQRAMSLDLRTAVSEVVVDEQHCRIALRTPIGEKASWIVLSEFDGHFPEASAAVCEALGSKCRTGEVTEGSWLPLIVMIVVIGASYFALR
jgi:hypothetical protein